MSFQPILSELISGIGDVKIHLSHKDSFIDPQKMNNVKGFGYEGEVFLHGRHIGTKCLKE